MLGPPCSRRHTIELKGIVTPSEGLGYSARGDSHSIPYRLPRKKDPPTHPRMRMKNSVFGPIIVQRAGHSTKRTDHSTTTSTKYKPFFFASGLYNENSVASDHNMPSIPKLVAVLIQVVKLWKINLLPIKKDRAVNAGATEPLLHT